MGWQRVMPLTHLSEGEMQQHARPGGAYLVCRTGGVVYAMDNECPHAGGPLAMGNFSPPLVACPFHAWEFDCRTGQCVHSSKASVPVYPVEVRQGDVWVCLPGEGEVAAGGTIPEEGSPAPAA